MRTAIEESQKDAAPGRQVELQLNTEHGQLQYLLFLPKDAAETTETATTIRNEGWPLILFLHGASETSKGGKVLAKVGKRKRSLVDDGAWRLRTVPGMLPALCDQAPTFPFITVSPQCPRSARFSSPHIMRALIHLVTEVVPSMAKVNTDRMILTGLSAGAHGTWALASAYPGVFAFIVPICGGLPSNNPKC